MTLMGSVHQVAIVLRGNLGLELENLARHRHVWAVRTPETEKIAERIRSQPSVAPDDPLATGLTLFSPGASPEESLLSILGTVELHHGEYSHDPAVSVMEVYGSAITEELREAFRSLGFAQVRPAEFGFIAEREPT